VVLTDGQSAPDKCVIGTPAMGSPKSSGSAALRFLRNSATSGYNDRISNGLTVSKVFDKQLSPPEG
jgi:hypothetical protein